MAMQRPNYSSPSPTCALQRVLHARSILAAEFGLGQVEHKGMEVVGGRFDDLYGFLVARL